MKKEQIRVRLELYDVNYKSIEKISKSLKIFSEENVVGLAPRSLGILSLELCQFNRAAE